MPTIRCPIPGCEYNTEDVEAVLAAALLNIHATSHTQVTGNMGHSSVKPPPMERPRLVASSAEADWEVFSAKWRPFKAATSLTGDRVVHQLLGCLDDDLASLIYNEHASPESLQEKELLELLQKVAVKPENIWITREKLHSMKQDPGEPVTSFAARLKGQARLCGFQAKTKCGAVNCNHENTIDFTETVVMGELVRGLGDPELKAIVLGEVE